VKLLGLIALLLGASNVAVNGDEAADVRAEVLRSMESYFTHLSSMSFHSHVTRRLNSEMLPAKR
jgi:hypothetical protein